MEKQSKRFGRELSRFDAVPALFLAVAVFLLVFFSLSQGCVLGDDHSAYILQGMAIAEGRFDEQTELNYYMHPSYMPDEAQDGKLVYVWGYSLILALVYKLIGYDRVAFTSLIWYKLPSVLAMAGTALVLYLFLRRRFGRRLSFFISWMFSLCGEFYFFVNTMYSDIYFLFFALLTLYVHEIYLDSAGRRRLILGIVTGILLWYMYEVRLNGISVLLACAAAHVIQLFARRKKEASFPPAPELLKELVPYALFILLKLLSEAIFAPATSNASDLEGTNLGILFGNLLFYFGQIRTFFGSMWNNILTGLIHLGVDPGSSNAFYYISSSLSALSLALCLLGMITDGIKRNIHLTVYVLGTLAVTSMLFYNQGLRYIFPILPVLVLYAGYGFVRLCALVGKLLPRGDKFRKYAAAFTAVLTLVLCLLAAFPQYLSNAALYENGGISEQSDLTMYNAFTPEAVEAYNHISENVPEGDVVGFFKPRLLYMNTGRVSVSPIEEIGHSLDECDWYLVFKLIITFPEPGEDFVPVWENEHFTLYKKEL